MNADTASAGAAESAREPALSLLLAHLLTPAVAVLALGLIQARHLGHAPAPAAAVVMVGGTVVAYVADRLWDRRDDRRRWRGVGTVLLAILGVAFAVLIAALACAGESVRTRALLLGVVSIAYPALKAVPGAKNLLVAAAWTIGVAATADAGPPAWPTCLAVFLMVAGAALLCDFKDARRDRATGVPSLVVLCGPGAASALAAAACLAAAAIAAHDHAHALAATAAVQAALAPWRRVLSAPITGPLLVDGLLALCPAFALAMGIG